MSLIVKIGANMDAFQREMNNLTRSVNKVTDKMQKQGENMAKTLTAPLAGIGLAAGVMATQFDDAQGMIQAKMGVTAKEAEKLNDTAQNLWKKGFGESVGEAAQMVANVGQNMKDIPSDQLEKVAEKAMTVSKIFGSDINEVTRTANGLMKDFGWSADEAFDYITTGYQSGMDYSGEFLDTLNEYGPQFASLGFSGEQMFETLAAGAETGTFQLDKVGDAVKEFNLRAIDGKKSTTEAFQALGFDAQEMAKKFAEGGPAAQQAFKDVVNAIASTEDPIQQAALGTALFGTQFEDLEMEAFAALGKTSDAFKDVKGSTQEAGNAIQESMGQRFQNIWREAQSSLAPLGEVLLNIAEVILPKLSAAISAVSNWFTNLSPQAQTFIVVLGGIVAAAGPVLIFIASMIKTLQTLKAAFMILKVAMMGSIGIWVLIGVAIVALVALVIIYWDEIVAATKAAWEWIGDFLSGLWDGIKNTAMSVWNAIKDFFAEWGLTILAVITGPIGWLVALIVSNWDAISAKTSEIWNAIKEFLSGVWEGIKGFVQPIFDGIANIVSSVWEGIKTATSAVWDFIVAYLQGLWNALMYFVQPVFESIWNFIKGVWDKIKEATSAVWTAIKAVLMTALNNIKNNVTTVFNGVKTVVTTIWNGIKSVATTVWNALVGVISGPVNTIKSTVSNVFNTLKSTVSNIWNAVKSVTSSVWNGIKSTIAGIVNGIGSAVGSAFNGMKSTALSAWEGMKSGIKTVINGILKIINKFIDGFNTPAKLLDKIPGVDMPKIPKVPMLATGGTIFGSGSAIVGEAGPELISKSGSSVKVTPLSAGEKANGIGGALGGSGAVIQVPISLDGQVIANVVAPYVDSKLRKVTDSKNRARGGW